MLVPSLPSEKDIGTNGNIEVSMVHYHQDRHMEDANDYQNDNGDQEKVLMSEEELP